MSTDVNSEITSYLNFYTENTNPKNYAVLIDGEWGAGKTHFIKEFIETKKKEKDKFIYISLYGLSNVSEIDDQIFKAVHPNLSSKPVALATQIIKGGLRFGLKLDLDGNGSNESSVDASIPAIKLSSFFSKSKDAILVFDDLERCRIPIDQTLGYINYFTEHENHRTIVVANESAILANPESVRLRYLETKEKLIGRTLTVVSDIEGALTTFLKLIKNSEAKSAIEKNEDLVVQTYAESTFQNLRSLKQVVIEWPRFFEALPPKAKNHDLFLKNTLRTMLILYFETKRGSIKVEDLARISSQGYMHALSHNENEASPTGEIEKKYSPFTFETMCPSDKCWHTFIKDGYVDKTALAEAIENNIYFRNEKTPSWKRLWDIWSLDSKQLATLAGQVSTEFEQGLWKEEGVVKHIAGMFLFFAKHRMITTTEIQTLQWLKKVIRKLDQQDKIEGTQTIGFLEDNSYQGMVFISHADPNFKKICDFIRELKRQRAIKSYPKLAAHILELLKDDSQKFLETMTARSHQSNPYLEAPILKELKSKDVVKVLLQKHDQTHQHLSYVLKQRYTQYAYSKEIQTELNWLKTLKKSFAATGKKEGGLVAFKFNQLISSTLDPSIKNLTEAIKRKG